MPHIRLAAAALNQTPFAWDGNLRNIVAAIDEARADGVGVLCLPELAVTGYGCEDMFLAPGVRETAVEMLGEIVPRTGGMAVCVGLPLEVEGQLYNVAALAADGRLVGLACKQFLAGDGIHYEPRWFTPWPAGRVEELEVAGETVPVGDLLFELGPLRIGIEICRDAWWKDQRPARSFVARGANLILNPSASHFAFAKQDIRREIALEAAGELGVPFVYCNLLGNESGRIVFDGGSMIAHEGEFISTGPRLVFADRVLTSADVPFDAALPESAGHVAVTVWSPLVAVEPRPGTTGSAWDGSPPSKLEEFSRAVPLGLFDYLRKSRSRGFVVSLSGGADSSAVAVLVWLMVRLGVAELGLDGFKEKLGHIAELADAKDERALVGRLLSCVYQSTRNSGEVTLAAARAVAEAVGASFFQWNVDALVDGYVGTVSDAIGRELDWGSDDVALQRTSRPGRGGRAFGCWPICAGHCCWLPATGARRRWATRRWTATRAAGCRRSRGSTRRSCASGSGGWRPRARWGSVRCRCCLQ